MKKIISLIICLIAFSTVKTEAQISNGRVDSYWAPRVVPIKQYRDSTWAAFFNKTSDGPALTVGYNRRSMRDNDAQVVKIQQATAGSKLVWVLIGDSWTVSAFGDWVNLLGSRLKNNYGDAGVGYVGASSVNGSSAYGTDGYSIIKQQTPNWAAVVPNYSTYVNSASINSDSSSVVGDSLYFVGKITDFVIHYMKKPSGGSFIYRIDGTSPTTVSTAGTKTLTILPLATQTDGTHTLSIKTATAGSGILINGVEFNRNNNGVRFHNIGASGSTSRDWILSDSITWKAGISQLAPNVAVISLGVNDRTASVTPTQYITNITRIVNRVLSARPNCSIVLFSQSDVGTVATYSMSQYVDALKTYALANGYAFVDNLSLLGDYTTANARGLYANTLHINNTGGRVFVDNFMDFLMDGKVMQYQYGINTNTGVNSFANAIATTTGNAVFGTSAGRAMKAAIDNAIFGEYSMPAATTPSFNTGVGSYNMFTCTTCTANVAIGNKSLYNITTGSNNNSIGRNNLTALNSGTGNNSIGANGMIVLQGGTNNAGIGSNHLALLVSGSNNVALGHLAGNAILGSGNVCLGANSGAFATGSDEFWLDNQLRSNLATQKVSSPLYGLFNATPSLQTFTWSAKVTTRYDATFMTHIVGASPAPTGTLGTGAGTGATFTLTGNDIGGYIDITTAGTPSGSNATILTVTFASAFVTNAPVVILTPVGSNSAALNGTTQVYVDSQATTTALFVIKGGTVGLTTGTVYRFAYQTIGK